MTMRRYYTSNESSTAQITAYKLAQDLHAGFKITTGDIGVAVGEAFEVGAELDHRTCHPGTSDALFLDDGAP